MHDILREFIIPLWTLFVYAVGYLVGYRMAKVWK